MEREKNTVSDSPPVDLSHTMFQTLESQTASQQLSEFKDLKQNPDAPKIKGYMLLKPIGKGAYAQVWEALQLHTHKLVAVKVFTKKSGVHWFFLQREEERLIRLDKHPHIVSLLDADLSGETPYYVMDLAEAGSLEKVLQMEKNGESPMVEQEKAVDWLKEIAQALSYVHGKQMVHCDLKPANVLLDEEGHVRVADFGHSRVLSESSGSLGTLFFMAPEQAVLPDSQEPQQPRVQWDIYAFGCTAYAILSGHIPHEEIEGALENLPHLRDRLELYRNAIMTQSVPELFEATQGRVDRDLSAIIAKCMKINAEERYQSMEEVLNDMKARREEKPVSPLAHDTRYWIRKMAWRHRLPVLIAGVAALIIIPTLISNYHSQKIEVGDKALNDVLRGNEFLEKDDLASAAAFFAASNKISPSLLARGNASWNLPPIPSRLFQPNDALESVAFSPDGGTLMTASEKSGVRLWEKATGRPKGPFLRTPAALKFAFFSPHASKLATVDLEGGVQLWNLENQKPMGKALAAGPPVAWAAFSPDGKKLVTAGEDGTTRVWGTAAGESLTPAFQQSPSLFMAGFSPDGKMIFTCGRTGTVRLWEAQKGHALCDPIRLEMKNAPAWYQPDVAFSPDSRVLMTTGWDGGLRFYDNRGRRLGRPVFLEGIGAKAVFSPDGKRVLASAVFQGVMGTARIVGMESRLPLKFILRSPGRMTALAFSPDGRLVITGGTDNTARLWDAEKGRALGKALWHGDTVTSAAFDPSGQGFVTGCKDGVARYWSLKDILSFPSQLAWKSRSRGRLEKDQNHAVYSHDGGKILTYGGKSACLWDASTGAPIGPVLKTTGTILRAVFNPDDTYLLTCDMDHEARLWDLATGKSQGLAHDKAVRGGAFNGDGKKVLTGDEDGILRLWDSASGRPLAPPLFTGMKINRLLFSPDGEKAAALGPEGSLRLFSLSVKQPKLLFKIGFGVRAAVFSPNSRELLTADGTEASIWDPSNGKLLKALKHGAGLSTALVSPDNQTVVTVGLDGTAKLWNGVTGKPIGNPLKHTGLVLDAAFSPGGEVLALSYQDGGYQLWDPKTGEAIGGETSIGGPTAALGFEADSRHLGLLSKKGEVLRMDTSWISAKTDSARLLLNSEVAGLCRVNDSGSLEPVPIERWAKLWRQYQKTK